MGSRINSLKHVTRQGWVFVFSGKKKRKVLLFDDSGI